MEALEFLLEKRYTFQRTFYIGFGHDEEVESNHYNQIISRFVYKKLIVLVMQQVSGFEGAGHIAKHLKSTGVDKLDFVLDEGYFVLEDFIEGVDQLVSV